MGRPNFIIIGAERCGTTSLYDNICKHSEAVPAYQKELEYFDKHYEKGEEWYLPLFKDGFTGEATPTYYWNPAVPERIKEFDPSIKILFISRPFEEAVKSKYTQQVIKGVETLGFKQALNCESWRVAGEFDRVRYLPYNYYPTLYAEYAYTDRYMYDGHLENWKEFDMLKLELKNLRDKPNKVMKTVFDFLGLPYEKHNWGHLNSTISLGEQGNSFVSTPEWAHDDLAKR